MAEPTATDRAADGPGVEAAAVGESEAAAGFSNRVLVFFVTQAVTAALGFFNGFFLARLIGPAGKGDYYLLTFLPPTLMILAQLGLPQAFGFFSARGQTKRLLSQSIVLTVLITAPILIGSIVLLPLIRETILHGLPPDQIVVSLLALPLLLNATFTTGIIVGRQAVRWLAIVNVGTSVLTTIVIVIVVGALGLGVWGALIAFLVTAVVQALGFLIGARRESSKVPDPQTTSMRELLRYGLPFYPTSLTQFFAYRVDVYLLAVLLAEPSAPLGYYSLAVSFAELVFFFPNAVSAFFFPHVAGSSPEDSARQVPVVSRVTLLITAAVAVALVPIATIVLPIILPAFTPSLPALYVLLPGVVAISISKVLAGYLSGLGRNGLTSTVSVSAFVLNVVLNLFLIPRAGIVGAATASLISYTFSSVVYAILAGRVAGVSPLAFWIPRPDDVRFTVGSSMALARRVLRRRQPG